MNPFIELWPIPVIGAASARFYSVTGNNTYCGLFVVDSVLAVAQWTSERVTFSDSRNYIRVTSVTNRIPNEPHDNEDELSTPAHL